MQAQAVCQSNKVRRYRLSVDVAWKVAVFLSAPQSGRYRLAPAYQVRLDLFA